MLAAGVVHLSWQAYRGSYPMGVDPRNPYVYSQTGPDIFRLAQRMEALAKVHPDGHHMFVRAIAQPQEYWPLPWYLRRFERVEKWGRSISLHPSR